MIVLLRRNDRISYNASACCALRTCRCIVAHVSLVVCHRNLSRFCWRCRDTILVFFAQDTYLVPGCMFQFTWFGNGVGGGRVWRDGRLIASNGKSIRACLTWNDGKKGNGDERGKIDKGNGGNDWRLNFRWNKKVYPLKGIALVIVYSRKLSKLCGLELSMDIAFSSDW